MIKNIKLILLIVLSLQKLPAVQFTQFSETYDTLDYNRNYSVLMGLKYINFFNIVEHNDAQKELYLLSRFYQAAFPLHDFQLRLSYQNDKIHGFINNIDSPEDNFRYRYVNKKFAASVLKNILNGNIYFQTSYNGYWGLGLGFWNKNYGILIRGTPYIHNLNYKIDTDSGSIPLGLYELDGTIFYKFIKLNYKRLLPLYPDNKFQNNIYGDIFSVKTSNPLPKKFSIKTALLYGNIRGYLDHFQFFNYLVKFGGTVLENHNIYIGSAGVHTWINKESYLEIWPFNYWSQLLASKTKISKADINLNLPFVEYQHRFFYGTKTFNLTNLFSLNYTHVLFENDIITKERYFIMFPVLMGYNTYSHSINPGIDGLFSLKNNIAFNYHKLRLSLDIYQLFPVTFRKSGQTGHADKKAKKTSGGFFVFVSLKYSF